MRIIRAGALVVSAALGWSAPTEAQFVQGVVLYDHDDIPVVTAAVRLVDERGAILATTLSGFDGLFAIRVPVPGTYWLHVEHPTAFAMVDGPLAVSEDANTFVTFHVAPQPFALEEITVEVAGRSGRLTRTGFYDREQTSSGFFMDEAAVARRGPIRTSDLVRGVPGVTLVESRTAGGLTYPLMDGPNRSRAFNGRPACFPRVYVDGAIYEAGGTFWTPSQSFDDLVGAYDIIGIEVYRSTVELPAQFSGLTDCGVILLWTGARGR